MTCRYGKSREVVRRRRVLAIRRVSSSGRMFGKSLSALPLSDTNQPRQHARDTRAEPDASLGPHRASPRTSHSPNPGQVDPPPAVRSGFPHEVSDFYLGTLWVLQE